MNLETLIDREAILRYLDANPSERRSLSVHPEFEVTCEVEAIARSMDQLIPLLRRLETEPPGSSFDQGLDCKKTVRRLESLAKLPFGESGLIRVLRDYELLDDLGNGAIGTVFNARHRKLDRKFAVKVLSPRLLNSSKALQRFQREMRASGQISHDNVVCVTDAGEENGVHFLVMELVDGVNLSQLVRALGPLPLPQAAEITRLACLGLRAIHDQGLVHRDIKPSNLMLDALGQVKVIDLGLSLLNDTDNTTSFGDSDHIVGTLAYMSPEQLMDSHGVDARTDLYGIGCTLHYLLVGQPPVHGHCEYQQHPGVAALIERLLLPDREQRFSSAAEVAAELQSWCAAPELAELVTRTRDVRSGLSQATTANTGEASSTCLAKSLTRLGLRGPLFAGVLLMICLIVFFLWPRLANRIDKQANAKAGESSEQVAFSQDSQNTEANENTITKRQRFDVRERQLATWVLQQGGRIKLYPGGEVTRLESLPSGSVRVQMIVLSRHALQDLDVSRFVGMSNLQGLELSHNRLTSQSMKVLAQVTALRWLYLNNNWEITDEGAMELAQLEHLAALDLSNTQVSDATVRAIAGLPKLRELRLGYTRISDACLGDIGRIESLVRLDLSGTKISNDGLVELKKLPELTYLLLGSTRVSDEAVSIFSQLGNLRELDLTQTNVSDDGLAELEESLPNCRVKS